MEFRVDIKGDTSGAVAGAAALRAEAAAARDATAGISAFERAIAPGRAAAALTSTARAARDLATSAKGAGLEVAAKGADALANAWTRLRGASVSGDLQKEQAKLSRLQAAQGAIGKGGASDVGAGRALQGEIDKSSAKVGTLSTRLAKAGIAGKDFKVSAVPAIKAAGEASSSAASSALRYGAALVGIGSLGALATIAVGWRNLGALQMIGMRATMDVRRLMTGVDSSSLVRGVSMLEKNLSLSTVTGRALSGILTRGFTGLFGMLERGASLISAVFEGMIIGALTAEIALLKARVALAPLTVEIEKWLGSEDAMETAAYAGAAGLAAIGVSAAIAVAPVLAVGAAFVVVGTAIKEAVAVYREWNEAARARAISAAGVGEAGERANQGASYRSDADLHLSSADYAKKYGGGESMTGTGKDLASGLVSGMASGEPAVAAGAAKLIGVANASARTAADAHSPSELMRRGVGKDLGTGVAAGMDDQADNVQAAADRSLVPTPPKGIGGGGGQGAAGGPVQFTYAPNYIFHGDAKREDVEAADRQGFRAGLRELTIALGLAVPT